MRACLPPFAGLSLFLLAFPAAAQTTPAESADHGAHHPAAPAMDHSAMPGMQDQASPSTSPEAAPTMDHSAHQIPQADMPAELGTALPAGNALAPQPPRDHYADRDYGAAAMAASRETLRRDHGGGTYSQVMLNLAEYQAHAHGDGYRWAGEAWFGGDINRMVLKSEGEGEIDRGGESAEVQALYSRALDPYWNLQAGVRHDFRPDLSRTYATIGIEGLAPYWFEVEAALFLSDKGDVLARLEGYHDVRLTQRLVLQPRAELNFAALDMAAQGIGSGLSNAELGLRLGYEIRREFAPYIGVSWDRKAGDTVRYARLAGERASTISFVFGIRSWF